MKGLAWICGTYSGIHADEASRPLNADDNFIEGVYAAGEVIGM